MAEDLSDTQRRIMAAIRKAIERDGYPPTVREIGAEVGLASPAAVVYQLGELTRKGHLRRGPGLARAIAVVDQGDGDR
jgi:repressor LexA